MKNAYNCITDFIFMEDRIEPADVILIPGCSQKQLIEHAVKLYQEGISPYILPSGGYNSKLTNYNSEWEFLYENAKKLGIPNSSILKEDKASNTFENAKFSLDILRKKDIKVRKAILVCKSYHARRAFLTYATIFPSDVSILVSPVIDGRNIRKDNWFMDNDKIHIVMSEVVKIGEYFKNHISADSK